METLSYDYHHGRVAGAGPGAHNAHFAGALPQQQQQNQNLSQHPGGHHNSQRTLTAKEWSEYQAMARSGSTAGSGDYAGNGTGPSPAFQRHSRMRTDSAEQHLRAYTHAANSPSETPAPAASVGAPGGPGAPALSEASNGAATLNPRSATGMSSSASHSGTSSPLTWSPASQVQQNASQTSLEDGQFSGAFGKDDEDLTMGRKAINPVAQHHLQQQQLADSGTTQHAARRPGMPMDFAAPQTPGGNGHEQTATATHHSSGRNSQPPTPQVTLSPACPTEDTREALGPASRHVSLSPAPSSGHTASHESRGTSQHLIPPAPQSAPPTSGRGPRLMYAPSNGAPPAMLHPSQYHPTSAGPHSHLHGQNYRDQHSPAVSTTSGSHWSSESADEREPPASAASAHHPATSVPHGYPHTAFAPPPPGYVLAGSPEVGYYYVPAATVAQAGHPRPYPYHSHYHDHPQGGPAGPSGQPGYGGHTGPDGSYLPMLTRQDSTASTISTASAASGTSGTSYESAPPAAFLNGSAPPSARSAPDGPGWYQMQSAGDWNWQVPNEEDMRMAALQINETRDRSHALEQEAAANAAAAAAYNEMMIESSMHPLAAARGRKGGRGSLSRSYSLGPMSPNGMRAPPRMQPFYASMPASRSASNLSLHKLPQGPGLYSAPYPSPGPRRINPNLVDPVTGIPLHLMPTKRSRGRRPVVSLELDLDHDIESTTASTAAQLQFSGVTKTGKPRKIFVCRVPGCDKCFRRSEHLKRHVRSIHTNEKPYSCNYPGCGKAFARGDNLKQHMKNLHNGWQGDITHPESSPDDDMSQHGQDSMQSTEEQPLMA